MNQELTTWTIKTCLLREIAEVSEDIQRQQYRLIRSDAPWNDPVQREKQLKLNQALIRKQLLEDALESVGGDHNPWRQRPPHRPASNPQL